MNKNLPGSRRPYAIMALVFILINSLIIALRRKLVGYGFDTDVLQIGNLILGVIFFISLALHVRSLNNTSTHAFMRSVYGGMMLKLFGCVIAAFIYIYIYRDQVNKPALFACMFLYFLYTAIELGIVMKRPKSS